jgi:hypothetical protein
MSDVMLAAAGLAVLNTVLAVVLLAVYARNHRELRSPFTLGLVLFALFLLVHNGMDVAHMAMDMPILVQGNEPVMLAEGLLQAGALGSLLAATLR